MIIICLYHILDTHKVCFNFRQHYMVKKISFFLLGLLLKWHY